MLLGFAIDNLIDYSNDECVYPRRSRIMLCGDDLLIYSIFFLILALGSAYVAFVYYKKKSLKNFP